MSASASHSIGQVAAARRIVLADVARDVGELEGEAEVAGAVERVVVVAAATPITTAIITPTAPATW